MFWFYKIAELATAIISMKPHAILLRLQINRKEKASLIYLLRDQQSLTMCGLCAVQCNMNLYSQLQFID